MTTHPTDDVVRRLLDEPGAVTDRDREHIAGCQRCREGLADRHAATHADADRIVHDPRARPPAGRSRGALLRRPAVAAVAVAAIVGGAGLAAAHDWVPIFRTERITPVRLDLPGLVALPDLDAYGDLAVTGDVELHEVPDAAAAAAETGLDVPQLRSLPRGVTGEPEYQVGGQLDATFTFSTARATRAADEHGATLPPPPPGLDGTQIRLVAGPGVAAIWAEEVGVPSLIVGRAVAPRAASSSGVPFETVRDYVLSMPGLAEDVAAQLRAFSDDSTLPLPVPGDWLTTSTAQVGGVPATVLATRDETLAAVVWVSDGVVTVVAGALRPAEVLSIADDLQ